VPNERLSLLLASCIAVDAEVMSNVAGRRYLESTGMTDVWELH
jgi:hypothetical protein